MKTHEIATNLAYGSTRAPDSVVVSDSRASDSNYTYVGVENVPMQDEFPDIDSLLQSFRPEEVDQVSDISATDELIELHSLGSSAIRLRKPLQLSSRVQDQEYAVEVPQVELYAFGQTFSEAIEELVVELVDLYQTLTASPSMSLSNKTLSWKLFLDQYITPVDGK